MNRVKQKSSQLIPFPRCSPIQISNRFATLGSTTQSIRPNYQSTLVSSYDLFQVTVPFSIQLPNTNYPISSPYLPKSSQELFIIEPCINHLTNPAEIAKTYFPPNFHFIPFHPKKSLRFYRDVLLETKSVEIKPIKDKNDPKIILFHSLYIHRILSQSDWGIHPYTLRTLESKIQYGYYDYIDTWSKVFLHQHIDFSHSWFINFDNKFKSLFLSWFLSWWQTHGLVYDLFCFLLILIK